MCKGIANIVCIGLFAFVCLMNFGGMASAANEQLISNIPATSSDLPDKRGTIKVSRRPNVRLSSLLSPYDIEYAQNLKINILDPRLPNKPLGEWLAELVGPDAIILWEGDVCGEGGEHGLPAAVCAVAHALIGECGEVMLGVVVGEYEDTVRISGTPYIRFIEITGLGPSESIVNLFQLQEMFQKIKDLDRELSSLPSNSIKESEAIAYAKKINMSTLNERLSSKPLEEWFVELAGPDSVVRWELTPCDMSPLGIDTSDCFDYWVCVNTGFENSNESIHLNIRVGTYKKGIFGPPLAREASVYHKGDGIESISLSVLPRVLEYIRKGGRFHSHK